MSTSRRMYIDKKADDLTLVRLYIKLLDQGVLTNVFHEGVPGPVWWLQWAINTCPYMLFARRGEGLDPFGIGWVNTICQNQGHSRIEVGFAFDLSYDLTLWDKLYAAREMLRRAINDLQPSVVYGTTPIRNEHAIAFAKRLGFACSAVLPKYTLWRGEPCDAILLVYAT